MIVEDEAILAMNVQNDLERLGHQVVGIADNCEKALEIAMAERPEIILMDIILKGARSGIDITGIIADMYRCCIIYMTAHTDSATLDRAKRTRHCGFIHKPFEQFELKSAIECALSHPYGE